MPNLSAGRPSTPEEPKSFTEEDVQRYAQFIAGHIDAPADSRHLAAVRAVLGALASDARLLPASSEHPERREVFKIWYRTRTPDGAVWCESSNPVEVVERSQGRGCLFERQVVERVTNPWEPWMPGVDGGPE